MELSISYLNPQWVNKENFLLLCCTILGDSYNTTLIKTGIFLHKVIVYLPIVSRRHWGKRILLI
jgi:hypothetical protein